MKNINNCIWFVHFKECQNFTFQWMLRGRCPHSPPWTWSQSYSRRTQSSSGSACFQTVGGPRNFQSHGWSPQLSTRWKWTWQQAGEVWKYSLLLASHLPFSIYTWLIWLSLEYLNTGESRGRNWVSVSWGIWGQSRPCPAPGRQRRGGWWRSQLGSRAGTWRPTCHWPPGTSWRSRPETSCSEGCQTEMFNNQSLLFYFALHFTFIRHKWMNHNIEKLEQTSRIPFWIHL